MKKSQKYDSQRKSRESKDNKNNRGPKGGASAGGGSLPSLPSPNNQTRNAAAVIGGVITAGVGLWWSAKALAPLFGPAGLVWVAVG
jgi:hypothetical protein